MSEFLKDVFAVLGYIGLPIFAVGAFLKLWGEKWLESHFSTARDSLNRAHDVQLAELERRHTFLLEELRASLTRDFDRRSRVHQLEFEAVPKAWELTRTAFYEARRTLSAFQSYDQISSLTSEERDEFLTEHGIPKWDRRFIDESEDPDRAWVDVRNRRDLRNAKAACGEATRYVGRYAILLNDQTKESFNTLLECMWKALVEYSIALDYRRMKIPPEGNEKARELFEERGDSMLSALERSVRTILISGGGGGTPPPPTTP
ncbi:hypothetical protein P6166_02465 [Stenotrophomonas sp. HITSZ_GD]|uniref:hypothetical protein n=1 Tax=Stenotrophomonas sp. HITSZ_GD TaxID=3037248 RepID=UPI00240D758B|nr:hypothetical protein [Stenotrophomonas sp. HITSZ_GD]MDG2524221.1 hypothetical protein [Stenotrophomonas sp. HITSZ_GD]